MLGKNFANIGASMLDILIGFDGFYYDNMEYFNVNLTKSKLYVGN